jgi:plasmid stability protein
MKHVPISLYVEPATAAALRARAAMTERSVSAEIRLALRRHLNEEDPAGTQGPHHDSGAGNAHAGAR